MKQNIEPRNITKDRQLICDIIQSNLCEESIIFSTNSTGTI